MACHSKINTVSLWRAPGSDKTPSSEKRADIKGKRKNLPRIFLFAFKQRRPPHTFGDLLLVVLVRISPGLPPSRGPRLSSPRARDVLHLLPEVLHRQLAQRVLENKKRSRRVKTQALTERQTREREGGSEGGREGEWERESKRRYTAWPMRDRHANSHTDNMLEHILRTHGMKADSHRLTNGEGEREIEREAERDWQIETDTKGSGFDPQCPHSSSSKTFKPLPIVRGMERMGGTIFILISRLYISQRGLYSKPVQFYSSMK